MKFLKSFKEKIFSVNKNNFEFFALELFRFQARNNPVYKQYLDLLNVSVEKIRSLREIPFLPIDFFKRHKIITGGSDDTLIFESSGTTSQSTSKNYIQDLHFYEETSRVNFENIYGTLKDYHILALLPSYLERNNSSLVYMVDHFIKKTGSKYSGFYLHNQEELIETIGILNKSNRKILLLGVSFALLDLAENYKLDLSNVVVMETGGMKGRRKEMIREELHALLKSSFGTKQIHSEYGMTELTSQAYAPEHGKFLTPNWMRVILRDINDPFDLAQTKKNGGINVIDLGNVHSCAFIETQDIGVINNDNTFEILGRFDNSDVRGCNLMVL
ncbi:acyl transferase [Fulvivirgaceae bacterium BMA10]|uniref:Acyl transferase n=1 Tax=Splendidivirga corallicola TaxID=3051826 RepID=A0ABT8KL02_9BACT|nr:acyl transferase [Fulvivirgaceae bacterium BMA10]